MPIIHIRSILVTGNRISKLINWTESSRLQAFQVGQVSFTFSLTTLCTALPVLLSPILDMSIGKGKIAAVAVAVGGYVRPCIRRCRINRETCIINEILMLIQEHE